MNSPSQDLSIPTCRVCLQSTSEQEMCSIFDLDADLDDIFIYEKIEQCAGIEVRRDENFPTFICDDCHGLLKVAYKFRITCRNTEEFLKNAFLKNKINKQTEKSLEKNPLSISDANKKSTCPVTEECYPVDSSPIDTYIKNEFIILPDSPADIEKPIADNFYDNDGNDLGFDINYSNDDENDMPTDENIIVSVEKTNMDLEKKQVTRSKIKRKNSNEKRKKTTKNRSKTLKKLCRNDTGDVVSKKTSHVKKEKKEKLEKRPHICEICGNKFPHIYTLKNHIKRHLNEKSFNCDICEYSSHSNMELVRHLRTHTGSKPYKCQYCTRAFGDQSTLIKHERVHRNERPFKCDICGSSFSYPAVLKRHKLVHTGEKPYKCEICGKCFNDRYHLQSHLKTIQHKNDPRVETLLQNIRENNV